MNDSSFTRVVSNGLLVILTVVAMSVAPAASARPTSALCEEGSYSKAHPLICDTGNAAPGSIPSSGGGGGNGGLLGLIHSLTGGLV